MKPTPEQANRLIDALKDVPDEVLVMELNSRGFYSLPIGYEQRRLNFGGNIVDLDSAEFGVEGPVNIDRVVYFDFQGIPIGVERVYPQINVRDGDLFKRMRFEPMILSKPLPPPDPEPLTKWQIFKSIFTPGPVGS